MGPGSSATLNARPPCIAKMQGTLVSNLASPVNCLTGAGGQDVGGARRHAGSQASLLQGGALPLRRRPRHHRLPEQEERQAHDAEDVEQRAPAKALQQQRRQHQAQQVACEGVSRFASWSPLKISQIGSLFMRCNRDTAERKVYDRTMHMRTASQCWHTTAEVCRMLRGVPINLQLACATC